MKRIIIVQMMFLSIYCSLWSCAKETSQSQCQTHTMEPQYNYLSCFKLEPVFVDDGPCMPFFIDAEGQKAYFHFLLGIQKESLSVFPEDLPRGYDIPITFDKEKYDKDEIIKHQQIPLTGEDNRIVISKNTCGYHYPRGLEINIEDENVCFNVNRFEDLKDILDCGYAIIKGKYKNNPFTIKTCFFIADNNAYGRFKDYYYDIYLKLGFKTFEEVLEELIKKESNKGELPAQDIEDFEITVKDRNGNIIVLNRYGERINGSNDEPKKISNSSINSLNFMLLLCLVLFLG